VGLRNLSRRVAPRRRHACDPRSALSVSGRHPDSASDGRTDRRARGLNSSRGSLARSVLQTARMFETLPVTPLSAALGELLVETRLLQNRWPIELDRKTLERALIDAHRDIGALLQLLGDGAPRDLDERAGAAAHEAYLSALCMAVMIKRIVERVPRRKPQLAAALPATAEAARVAAKLLDLLDPFVERKDVALRLVMLDGQPMDKVSAAIALPA
jgi:hypothetical protein